MDPHRFRIRFAKQGDLRLISHRDLVRAVERLFRRAEVAVCQSQGFHPKPRLRFASALTLGVTGLDEVLEVDLVEAIEPSALAARLNAAAPAGLTIRSAEVLPAAARKAQACGASYELPLEAGAAQEALARRAADFLAAESWPFQREPRGEPIDLRPLVEELCVEPTRLRMRLRVTHQAGARPRDLLAVLGHDDLDGAEMRLVRTAVTVEPGDDPSGTQPMPKRKTHE